MKKNEIIFGIHPITEQILSGKQIIGKIWIKTGYKNTALKNLLALVKKQRIPYSNVPVEKLQRLTTGKHQGIVALISPIPFFPVEQVVQDTYDKGKLPLLLLLDHIQDVRNLGAIARTALATNVDAMVMSTKHSVAIDGNAIKASAGALAHLPVCRVSSLADTLHYLQASGLQIVACTEKGEQTIYQTDFQRPTAILLGGEGRGINPKYLQIAHQRVSIPMVGSISSLNVSVASAVILYEAVRQHHARNMFKVF